MDHGYFQRLVAPLRDIPSKFAKEGRVASELTSWVRRGGSDKLES